MNRLLQGLLGAILLALSLAVGPSAAATEACASTSAALSAALDEAEAAWADLDQPRFLAETDRALALLPCLRDAVPRSLAAALHRSLGLRAVVDQDLKRAGLAFAAARALEPAWHFPDSLLPPGHPILKIYDSIPVADLPMGPAPTGPPALRFDGRAGVGRPLATATLLQAFDAEGAVAGTWLLWPEDPLPAWPEGLVPPPAPVAPAPLAPPPVVASPSPSEAPPAAWHPRWALLGAAGGGALAAATLYGLAGRTAAILVDPDTHPAALATLRARTNGLVLASGGAGLVAAGLGVGAFVAVRW